VVRHAREESMEAGTGAEGGSYETISRDARNWAMGCHLIALVGLLGNGLGFLVGPLIVWLVKREDDPFIDEQGKESVNFQITMILAIVVCVPLMLIVIGFPLLMLIGIWDVVLTIIAGVKAANGEHWRYPATIRFIK
jgi:uncharacterized Tic20 family protein